MHECMRASVSIADGATTSARGHVCIVVTCGFCVQPASAHLSRMNAPSCHATNLSEYLGFPCTTTFSISLLPQGASPRRTRTPAPA